MPLTRTRTPDITGHVTARRPDARWRVAPVVVLAALVFATTGATGATAPPFPGAAEVVSTAERVVPGGRGLMFPIDPEPNCFIHDNFGGDSKAFGPGGHQGVDIGADLGQAVYAVESGMLVRRIDGDNAGLGWELLSNTDVVYRYYHLAEWAEGLEEGDLVRRGQVIGSVGDTGNATPGGWHLHFEVRPGPQPEFGAADPVDPLPLLEVPDVCVIYDPD